MNATAFAPSAHVASFAYLETTIPAGMKIADYRRSLPAKPSRMQRLASGVRGLRSAASQQAAPALVPASPAFAGAELARPGLW
jgi:hypothetical protein